MSEELQKIVDEYREKEIHISDEEAEQILWLCNRKMDISKIEDREAATGYEYEEEKKIIEYDKDGNVKPVKIEKTKKHVPPDVTAQIFWLKNRQRDRWQDRPQDYVDQTSDNDAEVQIYLPDNGRDD